jgi:RNA ligase (TIGR02306 family)
MKLATIERIKGVKDHPNADRLDLVTILGYQLVTQKGLYEVDDLVIYIKPDTVLPQEPWTEEFRKYSPKRVKAVKLRGEFSEGIIVSKKLLEEHKPNDFGHLIMLLTMENEGEDVSETLQITKYEPPMPQDQSAKGGLPFGIPKTDEERWENIVEDIPFGETVDLTLKIDGQSCSFYYDLDSNSFGVLGRSFEFKDGIKNRYTDHLERYGIKEKLSAFCKRHGVSLCLRGESYGEGIQSGKHNPYSQRPAGWAMFSVWNIKTRRYERKGDQFYFLNICEELDLPTTPVVDSNVKLTQELVDVFSKQTDLLYNEPFEGVVVQHPQGSFKIINKSYDSKK